MTTGWVALMPISEDLSSTLVNVARLARLAVDPWWIISSSAVALHGVDLVDVADVDLLVSTIDAKRLLAEVGSEFRRERSDRFRSEIFGAWLGNALVVEIMANFRVKAAAGWRQILPTTRQSVQIHGESLFVPNKDELIEILHMFGRPKDFERAAKLGAL
jgi:hypothetical protein